MQVDSKSDNVSSVTNEVSAAKKRVLECENTIAQLTSDISVSILAVGRLLRHVTTNRKQSNPNNAVTLQNKLKYYDLFTCPNENCGDLPSADCIIYILSRHFVTIKQTLS